MVAFNRRRLLAGGAAGAALGLAGCRAARPEAATAAPRSLTGIEPFHGAHQAGITTTQQDRLLFAAFDLTAPTAGAVRDLLQRWTTAAARLTAGLDAEEAADSPLAPPADTGEAAGLDPAHLTLTFGVGPGLFERDGVDRYGLRRRRPEALVDLPAFPGDALDPGRSGGDLCVQACSHDPQVAYHAIRNLARMARGSAVLRWTQQGFGRTSATTAEQQTPRNLMGFKDGTENLREDSDDLDEHLWVPPADGPAWMVAGTYLVVRRIRIFVEVWDRASLADQEATIGRTKAEGAPLGAGAERDEVDLRATDADGAPLVPATAHVRLAHQRSTGRFLLRRGYSFTDGVDVRTGQLDAGLFFLAYQRDPRRQFIPIQTALGTDALNEYIQHVGSAIFAIPPGVQTGGTLAAGLFE